METSMFNARSPRDPSRRRFLAGVSLGTLGATLSATPLAASATSVARQEASPAAQAGAARLLMDFRATVRQGPHAGLILQGILDLPLTDTGAVDAGVLTQPDESTLPVVGQITGRSVSLLFNLGEAGLVYGVGTSQFPANVGGGVLGGPFVGPGDGDSGDWAATAGDSVTGKDGQFIATPCSR
jgi:hypothetical protein